MKKILFILFALLPFVKICSQNVITFENIYGGNLYDEGKNSFLSDDGGYFIFGNTSSFGNGNYDIYLVRTDSIGKPLWFKTFGTHQIDYLTDVCQYDYKTFVLCGFTNRNLNSGYDVLVMMIDTMGSTIWEKTFGGNDWDLAKCIMKDSTNNIIVGGLTFSESQKSQFFYMKIDNQGNTLWTKTYCESNSCKITACLNIAINKYLFSGTIENDTQKNILYLVTDSSGNPLWTKLYGNNLGGEIIALAYHRKYDLIYGAGYLMKDSTHKKGYLLIIDTLGNIPFSCHPNYWNDNSDFILTDVYIDKYDFINIGVFTEMYGAGKGDFLVHRIAYPCDFIYGKTVGGAEKDILNEVKTYNGNSFLLTGTTESYGNLFSSIYFVKTDSMFTTNGQISNYVLSSENYNYVNTDKIIIYPNPTEDYINILFPQNFSANIEITNLLGEVLIKLKTNKSFEKIDLNHLKRGLYFCIVNTNDKKFIFKVNKL